MSLQLHALECQYNVQKVAAVLLWEAYQQCHRYMLLCISTIRSLRYALP